MLNVCCSVTYCVRDDYASLTMRPNKLNPIVVLILDTILYVCCSVTYYVEDDYDVRPTMKPNNLKHSTNLQKLK